jgi:hypothetical protein
MHAYTQLALAKAKTYKLGFYEGKMCIGDYKGASVQVYTYISIYIHTYTRCGLAITKSLRSVIHTYLEIHT